MTNMDNLIERLRNTSLVDNEPAKAIGLCHDAAAALQALQAENERLRDALRDLNADWHNRSDRPCPTCQPISDLLGEPFGCYLHAKILRDMRIAGQPKERSE